MQSSQTWGFGHLGIVISPHKQKCIFFLLLIQIYQLLRYTTLQCHRTKNDNYTDIVIPYKIQLNISCILTIDEIYKFLLYYNLTMILYLNHSTQNLKYRMNVIKQHNMFISFFPEPLINI